MTREPLLKKGALVALAASLLTLLAAFGVPVTDAQRDAVLDVLAAATAVLGPMLVAWLGRRDVTPVDDPRSRDNYPLVPDEPLSDDFAV